MKWALILFLQGTDWSSGFEILQKFENESDCSREAKFLSYTPEFVFHGGEQILLEKSLAHYACIKIKL